MSRLTVFVGQLPASRIDVFSFAATDIYHDMFAFEVADELIPAGIRTVTVGGVVHFVVLDDVDFHGELPAEQGECLGIIKTCLLYTSLEIIHVKVNLVKIAGFLSSRVASRAYGIPEIVMHDSRHHGVQIDHA